MNSIEKRLKRLEKARDAATATEAAKARDAETKAAEAANRTAIRDLRSLARGFDRRGRFHIGDIARQEIERRQATLANR